MRSSKLIVLSILALGLASPAFAQKRFGISIGTGVSVGALLGHSSIHVGLGNSNHYGYVSSRYRRPSCVWIPGHYEIVYQQVWIPASTQRIWIEPVYATRYDTCGRSYRVVVQPSCWQWVETPGHYESRPLNRWVDGSYR